MTMNSFNNSSSAAYNKVHGIKAASQQIITSEDLQWEDPEELKNELLPVKPFTEDMLPDSLSNFVFDESYRMQCPPDYIAVALLVTMSSVIGAGCSIRPKQNDTWSVVPNLWGGIIAPPGELKTPALASVVNLLKSLEDDAYNALQEEKKDFEADKMIFTATRSTLESEIKTAVKDRHNKEAAPIDAIKKELIDLEEPIEPKPKRYLTNDSTVAKLTELLASNTRGLLVFKDELTGLLASLDREDREEDKSFYLEAWNGSGSHTTDRIKRGTTRIPNTCLSLLGGIQPDKILSYLAKTVRLNNNDGFVQRFQLLVYPDRVNWEFVDQKPDSIANDKVRATLKALSNSEFINLGAELNENTEIPYFHFSLEAQGVFNTWLVDLQKRKLRSDDESIILEHLSKYRSLLPSLALIFHLSEVINTNKPGKVTAKATQLAINWCDYLESHARRVYGQLAGLSFKAAIRLCNKIKSNALEDGFSARDVQRKGWQYLDTKEAVIDACELLIDANWLKMETLAPGESGGPKRPVYRVNPKAIRRKGS